MHTWWDHLHSFEFLSDHERPVIDSELESARQSECDELRGRLDGVCGCTPPAQRLHGRMATRGGLALQSNCRRFHFLDVRILVLILDLHGGR